jgi:hypothetical protein
MGLSLTKETGLLQRGKGRYENNLSVLKYRLWKQISSLYGKFLNIGYENNS